MEVPGGGGGRPGAHLRFGACSGHIERRRVAPESKSLVPPPRDLGFIPKAGLRDQAEIPRQARDDSHTAGFPIWMHRIADAPGANHGWTRIHTDGEGKNSRLSRRRGGGREKNLTGLIPVVKIIGFFPSP